MKIKLLILTLLLLSQAAGAQEGRTDWRLYPQKAKSAAVQQPDKAVANPERIPAPEAAAAIAPPVDSLAPLDSVENTVIGDARFKVLLNRHRRINTDQPPTIAGFRIQIAAHSGPGSERRAERQRIEFSKEYAHIPVITDWQSPNFIVKAGDFRTRLEALRFYQEIKELYPTSIVIRDRINLPAIDPQEPISKELE